MTSRTTDNLDHPSIPDGWALVPIEPTVKMLFASETVLREWRASLSPDEALARSNFKGGRCFRGTATKVEKHTMRWQAMIANAPEPPRG